MVSPTEPGQDSQSKTDIVLAESPKETLEKGLDLSLHGDTYEVIGEPKIRLEDIYGYFPRVTSAPTWSPRKLNEQFAVDETTNSFYFYDFTEQAWKNILALPSQSGNSGKFLTTDGSSLSWGTTPTTVTVTAGETLSIGDVVFLYKAVGNFASDGYNFTNGNTYAVRAAANDTTYSPNILGIMTSAATYLGTGTCVVVGYASGLTGLTGASKHYLSNYSGASSETISQTSQDSEQQFTAGVTVAQVWSPTESRFDKLIVKARKNGGGAATLTCTIKRHSTTLATPSVSLGANSASLAEFTLDPSDFRTYKGELLTFNFTCDTEFGYIGYQASTDPYTPGGASGGSIPSNSDIYMKVHEFTNFGKIATSAGTRKFKMGHGLSSTELAVTIQEADSIL